MDNSPICQCLCNLGLTALPGVSRRALFFYLLVSHPERVFLSSRAASPLLPVSLWPQLLRYFLSLSFPLMVVQNPIRWYLDVPLGKVHHPFDPPKKYEILHFATLDLAPLKAANVALFLNDRLLYAEHVSLKKFSLLFPFFLAAILSCSFNTKNPNH